MNVRNMKLEVGVAVFDPKSICPQNPGPIGDAGIPRLKREKKT